MRSCVPRAADKPLRPIEVTAGECDGSFERMLRRFSRMFRDEGIEAELRLRRGYIKPSQRRRMKRKRSEGMKNRGPLS